MTKSGLGRVSPSTGDFTSSLVAVAGKGLAALAGTAAAARRSVLGDKSNVTVNTNPFSGTNLSQSSSFVRYFIDLFFLHWL